MELENKKLAEQIDVLRQEEREMIVEIIKDHRIVIKFMRGREKMNATMSADEFKQEVLSKIEVKGEDV